MSKAHGRGALHHGDVKWDALEPFCLSCTQAEARQKSHEKGSCVCDLCMRGELKNAQTSTTRQETLSCSRIVRGEQCLNHDEHVAQPRPATCAENCACQDSALPARSLLYFLASFCMLDTGADLQPRKGSATLRPVKKTSKCSKRPPRHRGWEAPTGEEPRLTGTRHGQREGAQGERCKTLNPEA